MPPTARIGGMRKLAGDVHDEDARHRSVAVSRFADMSAKSTFFERPVGCGSRIRHVARTTSTNVDARSWAEEGAPDGAVVVADHQTAGRGRFARTWESAPGQNLLLTLILQRSLPRPAHLPLAIGWAVRETVAQFLPGSVVRVKWPNDVRIDGRKVAGILVESPEEGVYLAGIGLNVNQDAFSGEMVGEPTSLLLESGQRLDRAEVFFRLMDALDRALELLEEGSLLDAYRMHLEGVSKEIRLQDGRSGILEGVDESGGLIVRTDIGSIVVHSGDVSLRTTLGPDDS